MVDLAYSVMYVESQWAGSHVAPVRVRSEAGNITV